MTADSVLDVRETDGEPFQHIVSALGDLEENETLELVNSFEPKPLYSVLEDRGFEHETERIDDDEWHVYIGHA